MFPFKQVEVPAADAGGLDPEQDIVGPEGGSALLLNSTFPGPVTIAMGYSFIRQHLFRN